MSGEARELQSRDHSSLSRSLYPQGKSPFKESIHIPHKVPVRSQLKPHSRRKKHKSFWEKDSEG